jgi:LemA protein
MWIINTYNKFQSLIIRINESEACIDTTLRKRFDLLNKSIGIIEENTEEKNTLEIIHKLRSKKLSNFELDRKLYDAINEYTRYKEKYEQLKNNNDFLKIDIELNETEAEIIALRKYYNDIITDYNKISKTFPTNIIALMFKYKKKTYFDGKNMDDEITNDFKL